jgi:hypothetical protein
MNSQPTKRIHNTSKSSNLVELLNESLFVLEQLGIPVNGLTNRRLERLAMVFLSLADVRSSASWKDAKGHDANRLLRSRDIIDYLNTHFEEQISKGSYDDIRRQELKLLTLGSLVDTSAGNPNSSRNDPRRSYAITAQLVPVLRMVGTSKWKSSLAKFLTGIETLKQAISEERASQTLPVKLPSGVTLQFSPGPHNVLQKAIIEEFLPRYGYGSEVLYVGDAADKYLVRDDARLKALDFFELSHGELPDIVAYSTQRRWLYLIEAVYSSGPVSPIRHLELSRLTARCNADIVYVTAFLNREAFRKFAADISWETEVWIADAPDHLIHFNGHSFMGPHNPKHQ